jgi:serine protease Do
MSRKVIFCLILMLVAGFAFGQTTALRNYVGMISQGFHPDIVTFLQKLKSELDKRGYNAAARGLENYIKGDSGTGFVYIGSDKKNYILTNYHVISQAHTLSITFETVEGEKTKFSDLQIVAADEDMDIALLALGGQNFFKEGLSLITRTIEEGEDVYSAGFPAGVGNTMVWQLGRGIISNASVRIPSGDDTEKMLGPFIQHTAQVDPGNSGGPLLVQARGVTTGYSVAGINTLKIIGRQAANYAIPVTRVRSFIDASMKLQTVDQRPILEERVNAFIKGLSANKAVYTHIAQFLSNTCVGENAEYAINELMEKASKSVRDNVFDRDIILGLSYSVAWTIENSLRSKAGSISVKLDSITPGEDGLYNVSFDVNGANVDSVWTNEFGIWRIRKFGNIASGDKTLMGKKEKERKDATRLKDNPLLMVSAGLAYPFDVGAAFGAELTIKGGKYFGVGFRGYFGGKEYTQLEMALGPYVPIRIGSVAAITPFANFGAGLMFFKNPNYDPSWYGSNDKEASTALGISARAGFSFTTAAVPGLFLQTAYQYNIYLSQDVDKFLFPDLLSITVGYAW